MATEQDRQRIIRSKLSRAAADPLPAISTGFAGLDAALGGGLPRGRILELFGPAACGKTALALQVTAHLQAAGLAAAWIDADRSFDPGRASSLGVSIESLVVAQPASAEEALEIAGRLASSMAVDLIVVDSAAALVPRIELEMGIGESGAGLQGRVLSSGLRKLAAALARAGAAAVFLNQTRGRGQASGEEETTAGGPALKLYAAARIALRPQADGRVRFRILKNKAAAAFAEGEFQWRDALGFTESP